MAADEDGSNSLGGFDGFDWCFSTRDESQGYVIKSTARLGLILKEVHRLLS